MTFSSGFAVGGLAPLRTAANPVQSQEGDLAFSKAQPIRSSFYVSLFAAGLS